MSTAMFIIGIVISIGSTCIIYFLYEFVRQFIYLQKKVENMSDNYVNSIERSIAAGGRVYDIESKLNHLLKVLDNNQLQQLVRNSNCLKDQAAKELGIRSSDLGGGK